MSTSGASIKNKQLLSYAVSFLLMDKMTLQYAKSLRGRHPKKVVRKVMAFRRALMKAQFQTKKE